MPVPGGVYASARGYAGAPGARAASGPVFTSKTPVNLALHEQCHPHPARVRRLPVVGALRLGRPSDVWFKPALSVVAAVAPPSLLLVALGRLDLAAYTMAGSLCALYAHHRPYAARAKVLAWVVLGMLGGLAVALVTASLTRNAVVLVTVGALLAAVQKAVCDATRVGPPAHVILTFVSSATLFVPRPSARSPATSRSPRRPGRGRGWWAWPPRHSARTARSGGPPPRLCTRPPCTPRPPAAARRAPAPGPPPTPPCTRPGRPSSRPGTAPPRPAAPSNASSSAPRSPSPHPPTPTPPASAPGPTRYAARGAYRVRGSAAGRGFAR